MSVKFDGPGECLVELKACDVTRSRQFKHRIPPPIRPPRAVAMACFRIDLSAYADVNEVKLDAWANHFFTNHIWKKPMLFGQVAESDYKKKQLQSLVLHNMKNWGTQKTKRYCKQWISSISQWDFAQECPVKKAFAAHRLQRLAAILSLENVGVRALKQNAEPALAKKAHDKAQENWKNFSLGEMERHRAAFGYDGDPEGWSLLKAKEEQFKEEFGKACARLQVCEEEALAKKQRVV